MQSEVDVHFWPLPQFPPPPPAMPTNVHSGDAVVWAIATLPAVDSRELVSVTTFPACAAEITSVAADALDRAGERGRDHGRRVGAGEGHRDVAAADAAVVVELEHGRRVLAVAERDRLSVGDIAARDRADDPGRRRAQDRRAVGATATARRVVVVAHLVAVGIDHAVVARVAV